jgi:hypothetical protein
MRKFKNYPGWAAALLLAFFAMACLLGPPPAQADGDWTLVDDPCVSGISPYDVFASSPSDVWIVGSGGAIIHYNGTAWSPMTSGTTNDLNGVWGSGPGDIYAVSAGGAIVHYNGTNWSPMASGTTNELKGVWGSGPGDVYAVGPSGTILHYNGTNWSPMTSGVTNTLYAVWGSGPTDVYVVGSSGKILHYNGTAWSLMTSGTTRTLYGVWGSGPTDVYAVGGSSTNTTVVHYNGTDWSNVSTGTSYTGLKGVWGSSPTDIYVVGLGGAILHYDGSAWTVTYENPGPDLTGISGSGDDVYAVGGGVVYRHTVTAAVPVIGVTLTPVTLTLDAGETGALTATVAPPDATNQSVQWSSGNEAVATVDANGTVTAVSPGTAVITVTTTDGGFTATCEVTMASQYSGWDVNNDGQVNVLDLIMIGQHFAQTGSPGWISEDINKDGQVNVLDMILVGQHWSG